MSVRSIFIVAIAAMGLPVAFAQSTSVQQQQQPVAQARATYYWLHPKLGMVKVERATGFMVVPGKRQQAQAGLQQPKPGHDHARMHKLM